MTSRQETATEQPFPDGNIVLRESYLDDKLDLITIVDSRDGTTEKLYGNRTESVRFIFSVEEGKMKLSRIFANSQNGGGHALDMKPTIGGTYRKTYKKRSLLDDNSMEILNSNYPDLRVDTRRIRDRILSFIS